MLPDPTPPIRPQRPTPPPPEPRPTRRSSRISPPRVPHQRSDSPPAPPIKHTPLPAIKPTPYIPIEPDSDPDSNQYHHPISPPTEELQYRAIGLVKGHYVPSEEQFTKGILHTADGTQLDAVLLGRIMNLVSKKLQSESPYLWVVYPRTRQQDQLHVQIMGVWAPEEMGKTPPPEDTPEPESDYFSIRGEIIFQNQEKNVTIVKIRQAPKKGETKPQSFKLQLNGNIDAKAVGYFCDLQVYRHGSGLTIRGATLIRQVSSGTKIRKRRPQRDPERPHKAGGVEKPQLARKQSHASEHEEHDESWSKPIIRKRSQ